MLTLAEYLRRMPPAARLDFAKRCETSWGHMRNVMYGYKPANAELAMRIEQESGREVLCEVVRPDLNWAYIRNTHSHQAAA